MRRVKSEAIRTVMEMNVEEEEEEEVKNRKKIGCMRSRVI